MIRCTLLMSLFLLSLACGEKKNASTKTHGEIAAEVTIFEVKPQVAKSKVNSIALLSSEIILETDRICLVSSYTVDTMNTQYFSSPICLQDYLSLSLISEEEFTTLKNKIHPSLFYNQNRSHKVVDTLIVELGDTSFSLIDKPMGEEGAEELKRVYNYVGELPFIEKILLEEELWETDDYVLLDTLDGEKVDLPIDGRPYFSLDQRLLVSISQEEETTVNLMQYQEGFFVNKVRATFINWAPFWDAEDKLNLHWVSATTFILKVTAKEDFDDEAAAFFLKIEVL